MLHKLEFQQGDERLFELFYEGFLGNARPSTREEHAATKGILKKLRAMSTETDTIIPPYNPQDALSPKRRALLTTVGTAFELFDDAEWQFLSKSLNPLPTPAVLSDLVVELYERLDKAPKGDAKELMAAESKAA